MPPDALEHPSCRPSDLDTAVGDDDALTDSDVVEQDAARGGRVEMSHNNAAPPDPLISVEWIETNVRDERFLTPRQARLQPQRLADLATHLYRVRRAQSNVGADADRAAAALALGTKAVQTWLLSGGFDAVMGRPLDGVARRQAARISNRGHQHGLDDGVVGVMRYVIVTRISGTESADGGFIAWGRDTTQPIRDVILPRLYGLSTECMRAYRQHLGLPQRVRLEGKGQTPVWVEGLRRYLTSPDGPAARFAAAADTKFRWPAPAIWTDADAARVWAIRGWFNGFFDDAGQTRPTAGADVHRIARHLGRIYKKEHGVVDPQPLDQLASQFEDEWTAVVTGCEQILQQILPKKFERLGRDRAATVRTVDLHKGSSADDLDDDDDQDGWLASPDYDELRDSDDHQADAGATASIDSDERNDDTTDLTGSFDGGTIDRAVERLLGLDGTPALDADTVAGLLVGVAELVQGGRQVDGEMIAANLRSHVGAGGSEALQGWVDELVRAASVLQQGAATDGDGGQ